MSRKLLQYRPLSLTFPCIFERDIKSLLSICQVMKSFRLWQKDQVLSYGHNDCSPIGMILFQILLGRFNDTLWSLTLVVPGKVDVIYGPYLQV